MRPLRGLQETRVATREESGVLAEGETADLWQPKWKENQTVLAAAIHTPDGTVAGS